MAEIVPGLRLTLYLHYLCPYGQRTLYTAAFKGFQIPVVEVDLEHKADWHLAMNPAGTSPTLKVEKDGSNVILTESIPIMEFFNSMPGPNLYPAAEDGRICPLTKAIVDSHGKILADPIGPALSPFFSRAATPEEITKAKAVLKKINSYAAGGNYILHSYLKEDVLTMADLLILPMMDRVYHFRESLFSPIFDGEDFSALFAWYERISALPWTAGPRADPKRLATVYKLMHEGTYHGLSLPITKYD